MYGKMKEYLAQTLQEIKDAGLYKEERLIESQQQAAIQVKGKEVLNFSDLFEEGNFSEFFDKQYHISQIFTPIIVFPLKMI